MKFLNLGVGVVFAYLALAGFGGSPIDAINGIIAGLNIGLFLGA